MASGERNFDPVLNVWRRRRGRDTLVSSTTSTTVTSPELEAAVKALANLGAVQGSRINSMDDRVKALERLLAEIGSLKR